EVTTSYSPNDAQLFGPTVAPHTGGITNTLSYKGFEVSALLSFAAGNYHFNNDRTNVEIPDYYADQVSRALLNEWRKPGDVTQIPNPLLPYQSNTTHFMEKGDFIRLRNLVVGYSLPRTILEKIKISSARIYFQGQNLWTGTKFQSFDPEISGLNQSLSTNPNAGGASFTGSLTGAQYPAMRQGTIGLQIGF
ncbi:MAG: TonB-dependent receptor, partial [Spirosomaceae bacterium]|nr:TonB-dependent receptor [Spirosomataceae bacterium]